jgi:hypothetical protein
MLSDMPFTVFMETEPNDEDRLLKPLNSTNLSEVIALHVGDSESRTIPDGITMSSEEGVEITEVGLYKVRVPKADGSEEWDERFLWVCPKEVAE